MTVGELLRRVSSRELAEWLAYFRLQAADDVPLAPAAGLLDPPALPARAGRREWDEADLRAMFQAHAQRQAPAVAG